jgi:hypothetical protein
MTASTQNMIMAAELSSQGGMYYAEASNDLFWGRMLRKRWESGDGARADQLLYDAASIARARGFAPIERLAQLELSLQA